MEAKKYLYVLTQNVNRVNYQYGTHMRQAAHAWNSCFLSNYHTIHLSPFWYSYNRDVDTEVQKEMKIWKCQVYILRERMNSSKQQRLCLKVQNRGNFNGWTSHCHQKHHELKERTLIVQLHCGLLVCVRFYKSYCGKWPQL